MSFLSLCLLTWMTAMNLFARDASILTTAVCIIAGLALLPRIVAFRFTLIDGAMWAIWIYDGVQCYWGILPMACLTRWLITSNMISAYYLFRQMTIQPKLMDLFLKLVCIIVGMAALFTLLTLGVFRNRVYDAGFTEVYSFRFMFRPLGHLTNVWSTLMFLGLGIASVACQRQSISKRAYYLLLFLLSLCLVLSFSRSVLILWTLFMITLLFINHLCIRKRIIASMFAMVALLAIVVYPHETYTALRIHHTVSQQKSTQNRIKASCVAWQEGIKHKWMGTGSGSYSLVVDKPLYQDYTQSYTTLAPNLFACIWIEKGIVGLVIILYLWIAIVYYCWGSYKSSTSSAMILIILIIIGLKEMTLCTAFHSFFIGLSLSLMLALLPYCSITVPNPYSAKNACNWALAANLCSLLLFMTLRSSYNADAHSNPKAKQYDLYAELLQAKQEGNLGYIVSMAQLYPNSLLCNYYAAHLSYLAGHKEDAMDYWGNAVRVCPRILTMRNMEILKREDKDFYEQLCTYLEVLYHKPPSSPQESARLGMIAFQLGNWERAKHLMEDAVHQLPNLSIPWYILGIIYQKGGNIEASQSSLIKYRFLLEGAFTFRREPLDGLNLPILSENDLWAEYYIKRHHWY